MNKKKITLLEIVILIVLITIFIASCIWSYKVLTKENYSTNNKINYEINKNYYEKRTINDLNKFKVPSTDKILTNTFKYEITYKTTDGFIKEMIETIIIPYNDNTNTKDLSKYCNNYSQVKNEYTLSCYKEKKTLYITNHYYVSRFYTDLIENNEFSFHLNINKETKYQKKERN